MKYYELDTTEKKVLKDFEQGALVRVKNKRGALARYRGYARASLNRERNINIRLSERDLQKIKAKAAEQGLPYQTLVASLLHQYTK